ncbi:hypothetical protein [Coleofasciculus sp. FACHB-SPT9]|uniref:hypothetical protein n=1 Tax=Cyanophyceae TaxID=3028117 RepID=UPI001682F6D8|nr:hypothetical protein [Coleofasciculus sp. FACHB-SPT9]MBD1891128.1 hypothetical protein [Coleofasciculus sp. FACHB-SPT9]
MRLQWLLWGAILSVGLSALPAQAQITDAKVAAFAEALRKAAPQTGKQDDGLYSDWQIKLNNIPRWSKQCTGRALSTAEFEANPATARKVVECIMGNILRQQYQAAGNNESVAVQRAAAWWMTGDPTRYNSKDIASYIQKVSGFYQQSRSTSSTVPPASTPPKPATQPAAKPTPTPTPSPSPTSNQPPAKPPVTTAAATNSAKISDTHVGALVEALRRAAPQTGTADDGLYSEWQVKPDNIPGWSQQCINRELTPAQFESSPVTARSILVCVMRDVLRDEFQASGNNEVVAVQRAASWWMTGDPTRYNSNETGPYTEKVLGFYQELRSTSSASPPTSNQAATNSATEPKLFPHR